MKDQQVGKKIIKDRVGQPRRRNMILEKMQQLFLQEGEDRIYQVVKTGDCQTRNMEYIHGKECGIFEGRLLCQKNGNVRLSPLVSAPMFQLNCAFCSMF